MARNNSIKAILNDLNETRKYLSEAYIFNGEEGMGGQPMPIGRDEGMPQQQGNSEEEMQMHAQEVIQHEPIVGKIRETAIERTEKICRPSNKRNLLVFQRRLLVERQVAYAEKVSRLVNLGIIKA